MESHSRFEQVLGSSARRNASRMGPNMGSALGLGTHLRLGRDFAVPRASRATRALPTVRSLAREMCAQRGFDIKTHGMPPLGGIILSVEDLDFDKALVLLSLHEEARVYADWGETEGEVMLRSLAIRSIGDISHSLVQESLVDDFSAGRYIVLSARNCAQLWRKRLLRVPIARAHLRWHENGSEVDVLVEA